MPFVSDWYLMIAEGYEEYAGLFNECINDKSSIEGIATFYFMLVAKNKDEEERNRKDEDCTRNYRTKSSNIRGVFRRTG